jgi:hypothetical protein
MNWLAGLGPNNLREGLQIHLQLGGELRLRFGAFAVHKRGLAY